MTRPRKQTVDYFPHYCHHGKTMAILEQKFGNDGYAFWFKLLELLGSSEGHSIDCNESVSWEYLQSISRLESEKCEEILNLLARVQAIDAELWEEKIVWSENFVQGISQAYRNRVVETPPRPSILRKKPVSDEQSDEINPPNKREGKGKEIKNPLTPLKSGEVPFQKIIESWNMNAPELLPRITLTETRKPKIKAAWKEHPDLKWFTALFSDISLSSWHSHQDKWKGCSFDWILKKRTEMREKLDALKGNGDARTAPIFTPPKSPEGTLTFDRNCPLCRGHPGAMLNPPGSEHKYDPCTCLHPINEVKNAPSEATNTAQ